MDVWSHVIDECGPKRIKKIGLRQIHKITAGSPSIRKVRGNLRFPLDKTYHGCPLNFNALDGNERLSSIYLVVLWEEAFV